MTETEARRAAAKPAASPDDMLKAVVDGKADPSAAPVDLPAGRLAARLAAIPGRARREARLIGVSGAALAIGAVLGTGVTALSSASRGPEDAVAALSATLDAGRIETARLGADIAQLHQILADLRASTDAARKEAGARNTAAAERLTQVERAVAGKVAALGDRLDQAEREQGARIAILATQLERRVAAPTPAAKAEPTQTGSLADARAADLKAADARGGEAKAADAKGADVKAPDLKPQPATPEKPPVIDGWAVRDVYDGTAIVENRKRRLVEVAPGDMLPGVGRVEGVERRGRGWVVVTRQGLVTPQPW